MIYLLSPPPNGRVSGGFRVNQALIRRLTTTGTGAAIFVEEDALPYTIEAICAVSTPMALVVDSLYLTTCDPERLTQILAATAPSTRLCFLLHFLPCLDPNLRAAARDALQKRERQLLALAHAVLVPGRFLADYVRAQGLFSGPVHICPPGIEPIRSASEQIEDPWIIDGEPGLISVGTLS